MADGTTGFNQEAFDINISAIKGYADELRTLYGTLSGLDFGSLGEPTSVGPCASHMHNAGTYLTWSVHIMCGLIDSAVLHLQRIADDIQQANAAGTGGA